MMHAFAAISAGNVNAECSGENCRDDSRGILVATRTMLSISIKKRKWVRVWPWCPPSVIQVERRRAAGAAKIAKSGSWRSGGGIGYASALYKHAG